ncbi:DegT/DnrJ/EryC1/StrS aminotransferase family protein [Mucilaginibacter sp. L196]|uniref:DegT/DnrJ/EryC1/StrS family aminotransferase n=1 Tax=Mucilaginibacter sp. L196 TaxID=1641870 RepID=UPI00131CCFCF|nr:DegT/DnrJ/EryC1/StrS family aminotransferase [Mucilaginibacter sp. L196]
MIPYENLKRLNTPFEDKFREKFDSVINNGHYILGPELEVFEKAYAKWHNVNYCIGISNGLDALILSLKACNFPEGSEVIVPSNTYIASILAILACQLIPVLVEPDIATYNIDPNKIEEAITQKTKAIMVVHLYGKCCQMDKITAIKTRHNLILVEDCAQSHGATFKGQLSGTFGEFGAFSFYPTKNLGALGDAGAIICNNESHKKTLAQLRNYGSERKYYNDIIGYNNRLDEMQAAFLSIKLKYLKEMNAHRNKLAQLYFDNLKADFILPVQNADFYDVFHIFNIRHKKRDELQQYLTDNGIGTVIHYPVPPHKQKALDGVKGIKSAYPIADEIHDTTLSIPCSFSHTEDEVMQVIEALNKFN